MHEEICRWYAVHVRSRCENVAAKDLALRGFQVCAALAPQHRVWADRVRTAMMPLFPGYIFARFDTQQSRSSVERASGVAAVVRMGNQNCPIDDQEIEAIQTVIRSGVRILNSPHLSIGTRVLVIDGPLAGCAGILEREKSNRRLVVSITLLQRSVAVELEAATVQPMLQSGSAPSSLFGLKKGLS